MTFIIDTYHAYSIVAIVWTQLIILCQLRLFSFIDPFCPIRQHFFLLKSIFCSKLSSALSSKDVVDSSLAEFTGNGYRIGKVFNGTYCPDGKTVTIHIACIHLQYTILIWKTAISYGFIIRIIFHFPDCRFDRIRSVFSFFQHGIGFFNSLKSHTPCRYDSMHICTSLQKTLYTKTDGFPSVSLYMPTIFHRSQYGSAPLEE